MPRNGQGVYSLPPVYEAVTGETIEAQQHNVPLEDIASDLNNARPISTGGTGGQSATQARENLDVYSKTESVQAAKDAIGELEAKETPVDADSVVIVDSEDGNKPKKSLWSKVKALVNPDNVGVALVAADIMPGVSDSDTVSGLSGSVSPLRKWTWGAIKNWLQGAFDLRYVSRSNPIIDGGTVQISVDVFSYMYWRSHHVAFYKRSGVEKFYWRKNNNGQPGGAGEFELMSLDNDGFLRIAGDMNVGAATVYRNGDISGTAYSGNLTNYIRTVAVDEASKKTAPQRCGRDGGIVEFGGVDVGHSNITVDLPAPYVLVGLRSQNLSYYTMLRGAYMKNNGG